LLPKENSFTMNYKKAISDRFSSKSSHAPTAAIALALVGGIAVGAVISLLFAPQSGEETRNMIADKTKNLAGGVKDKFRAMKARHHANGEHVSDNMSM
jgi:F0F1-type ATP synthase assembly protein I